MRFFGVLRLRTMEPCSAQDDKVLRGLKKSKSEIQGFFAALRMTCIFAVGKGNVTGSQLRVASGMLRSVRMVGAEARRRRV